MDHGEGPGAARGSEKRKCHRGREDLGSTSEEEWSTGKVGVTVKQTLLFLLSAVVSPFPFAFNRPYAHRETRSFASRSFANRTRCLSRRPAIDVTCHGPHRIVRAMIRVSRWYKAFLHAYLTVDPFVFLRFHDRFRVRVANRARLTVFRRETVPNEWSHRTGAPRPR